MFSAPVLVRYSTECAQVRPPTFNAPVMPVLPNITLDQVAPIRASFVSFIDIVPACPVPIPIVVAADAGAMVRVPVPTRSPLMTMLEFVVRVRLFAPMERLPLTLIKPEEFITERGSLMVRAPIFTAPLILVFPIVTVENVDIIRSISVSVKWSVPACPVPRPTVVATIELDIERVLVPFIAAATFIFALVVKVTALLE